MKIKSKSKKAKTSKINKYMEQPAGLVLVNERGFPEPLIASCFKCL